MTYIWVIIIVLCIASTHSIAKNIGDKRRIGFRNSVLWSLLLSPLIGLFITLFSKVIAQE